LKPPLAKVAIVIDDFGPDVDTARKFLALPIPITFSILPFQRHSKDIAELAHSHNREVILHAPMEPQGYPMVKPGTGGLLISMSSAEVQKRLRDAADSCPYAAGINNHMGSRFTENIGAMGIVLAEMRNRGLYFLDSYTSSRSMAYSVAEKMQVPHLRRDIFLDHVVAEDQIRAQLNQLVRKAKVQGRAIAIGHPHEATLHVLAQEAAMFQKEGIMVVPAGELVSAAPSIPSPH
jgi:polysaccharide deacetylase 2 family uncharacterized protein YibQ